MARYPFQSFWHDTNPIPNRAHTCKSHTKNRHQRGQQQRRQQQPNKLNNMLNLRMNPPLLGTIRSNIQNELRTLRCEMKRDWDDAAAAGARAAEQLRKLNPSSRRRTSSKRIAPYQQRDDEETLVKKPTIRVSAMESNFRQQIRNFESDLRSPSFIHRLNKDLRTNKVSSSAASALIEYYQSRPELKEYTIQTELPRIQYVLYTPSGRKLTSTEEISNFYNDYRPSNTDDDDGRHELLWRSANQSIFADSIASLTSPTGLVRPQLATGTCVDDCTITIDFTTGREPFVRAECFLNISIPGDGRHVMAGAVLSVFFCPGRHQFIAKVLHISPAQQQLHDEEVNEIAKSLVIS